MYSIPLLVFFKYTTTRVSPDHNSHTFCYFVFVCLKRYLFVVCGGLIFLFFVAPSLVVFNSASAFNQDVSNWNTGAVTTMRSSKCTLSPSLWPRLPLLCFWVLYDNSSFIRSQFSHVLLFYFCVFETVPFLMFWWVGYSFLRCTLSCSV